MRNGLLVLVLFGAMTASCSSETETREVNSAVEKSPTYMEEVHGKALSASPHGPVAEVVDWETAQRFPTGDAVIFPESEREKLHAIRVPVLAPRRADLLNAPIVTHKNDWYAISSRQIDTTFYIRGTRLAVETELEIYVKPPPIAISRTHGIVTASFRKFGVSYNLDIECTSPERNPLCADDDAVTQLVEDLVIYGGQP